MERKTCGIKVNHLPPDITTRQVKQLFVAYGDVADVVVRKGAGDCHAFVNFHSESCAHEAAKWMNGSMVGGQTIKCKVQSEFERERRSTSVGEYTLKVTHISKHTTENTLKNLFCLGNSNAISSLRILSTGAPFNYAYVNYLSRVDAEAAASSLDRRKLDGATIKVKLQESQPSPEAQVHGVSSGHSDTLRSYYVSESYPTVPPAARPPIQKLHSRSASETAYSPSTPMPQSCTLSHPSHVVRNVHQPFNCSVTTQPVPNLSRSHSAMPPTPHQRPLISHAMPQTIPSPQPNVQVPIFSRSHSAMPPTPHQRPLISHPMPQTIPSPQPNVQVPIFSRSHSAMPPTPHQRPLIRQFSHPMPQTIPSPSSATPQSRTVKVSMFSELSADDIDEVFSRFGPLRNKPIIRGGNPFFAFVNFCSPEAAVNAVANLQNSFIKQVKILCRVYVPRTAGPNIESEDVQCSPLTASILNSKYREELGKFQSDCKVKVTPKPSSHCVRVWGMKENVAAVKVCLQSLLEKIEGDIAEEECDLPCHSVPLFEQGAAVEKFKKMEENHGVEFQVLKSPDDTPTQLASFSQEVKNCFDPQQSADKIPECSELASYMREEIQSPSTSQPGTTWLWQNDSASGFIPYSSDTSAELSTAFSACPSGKAKLKIGAYTYFINFSQMTQTNISSGRSRPIRQASSSSLSVQWFYQNDEREFSPYAMEQSERIEKMFQVKAPSYVLINDSVYTFDFTAMVQYNAVSKKIRKIERRVEITDEYPALSVEHVLTLQARGLPDSLEPALKELKETVERATVVKECRLNTDCSNGFKARLVKNMNKYFVTTELVDDCLKLKGMPRYVERVHLLAEQEKIADREQQIQDGAGGMELPAHWSPQSEEVCLYKVQRNSDEWKKEVASIQKTLDKVAIVKLERIQNKWLWERYSFAKKQMSKKNKGCVNEKHLFHGTRTTPPEKVFRSEKGVDFRFSRKGLWGMGSYFAVNASYSDKYAYHTTALEKQMLICKVLTGDSYNATMTDGTLRQPPLKPVPTHGSFEEERYDSVKGNTKGSYVYVVYDHEKMYPAYLVTYRVV